MWLIDTKTLCLTDIQQPESVQYAILSHCWRDGQEVSFHEFAHLDPSNTRQKPGFSKIFMTCGFARRHGIPYAWIDTCCIDKSSSAELSEAINSMFRWYQRAKVCFVFLADMPSQTTDISLYLEKCRWFTRGWTLQELIAPEKVEFYDQAWGFIGTKTTLVNSLSDITKISREILQGETDFGTISVAQRMSWAAHRSTTRTEDLAYCLFGISDVHLPLIYGEGHKAFTRLQEAILQNSADLSLFAWTSKCGQKYRGAFAKSPAEFENC
ncbi:heterokaryon incompatibility protein-domain-containing protein, partial [Triangularia verruculosa]